MLHTYSLAWVNVENVSYAQVNQARFTGARRIPSELKAEQCCFRFREEQVHDSLSTRKFQKGPGPSERLSLPTCGREGRRVRDATSKSEAKRACRPRAQYRELGRPGEPQGLRVSSEWQAEPGPEPKVINSSKWMPQIAQGHTLSISKM